MKLFNFKNATHKGEESRKASPTFQVEPLEPRLLLSADMSLSALAGQSLDVTLRLDSDRQEIQIVDNTIHQVVQSQAVAEIRSLTIIGTDLDDHLTIDLSTPFTLPEGIIFEDVSGSDNDTLEVIGQDNLFDITDQNQGTVNGDIQFSGIENLVGDVGTDTFHFTATGSMTGTIDGASGVQDTVLVQQTSSNDVVFNYSGADSGSIERDGQVVALYTQMDAVTLTSSGPSPPTNVTINITNEVSDKIILKDDGITDNGLITIAGAKASFVETTFQVPSDELRITSESGNNEIQLVQALGQTLEPNFILYIDGQSTGDSGAIVYGEEGSPIKLSYAGVQPAISYDVAAAEGDDLNDVIDDLLGSFDSNNPPTGEVTFSSSNGDIPNIITIGILDVKLQDVTLTFSNLVYDTVNARWTGQVVVAATNTTLFPGQLDIDVTDSDDADLFAVVGIIYLVDTGNPESFLTLDDLDAEDIGWPSFLDIEITDLKLEFPNFRADNTQNDLYMSAAFLGLDTGSDALNDLLSADNPLFGLSVEGSVTNLVFDMDAIQQGTRENGKIIFPNSPIVDLGGISGQISGKLFKVGSLTAGFIFNTVTYDPDGSLGPLPERSAMYMAIRGDLSFGAAITGDSDDGGIASFGFAFAISELGPLQLFAYSDVTIPLEPTTGLAISSVRFGVRFNTTIEGLQTEPDFDITDATDPIGETVSDPDDPDNDYLYKITLTVPDHDLEVGDDFRILNANNEDYNGDFKVLTVNGDEVTYRLKYDPGLFIGDAQLIRLTIRDPLDLRDEGLNAGVAPPESILVWQQQLDQQVRNQLEAGDDIWAQLFGEVVFGGGASLSFDPRIPDMLLSFDVDLLFDTDLRIFMRGQMSLLDGLVKFPTRQYADLSDLFSGSGRFLYLQTQPEIPVFDPLLVYRGAVSFETLGGAFGGYEVLNVSVIDNTINGFWEVELELAHDNPSEVYTVNDNAVIRGSNPETFDGIYRVIAVNNDTNSITIQINCDLNEDGQIDQDEIDATNPGVWGGGSEVSNENTLVGFRIELEGGVDLNIPGFDADLNPITVTTLTLEGGVAIEFRVPAPSAPEDFQIELSFNAALSETHVGNIAFVAGKFGVTVDVGKILDLEDDTIVVYGAARLETMFGFLENVGLFISADGFLRINSGDQVKQITLPDINDNPVDITLPGNSFALKLGGSVDFRIDFNGNSIFQESESAFEMAGVFVLEFSTGGFNAAVFSEHNGNVEAATLRLGPKDSPFIEFDVFAFLAIRGDGFAANLVLHTEASLPLDLANLDATAVFIVNTTGHDIIFEIPGDGSDPDRPTGLELVIPGAAPVNPSAILAGHGPNGQSGLSLDDLIDGNTSWARQANPGPYGVVFVDGGMNLLSLLGMEVSGYILLSEDVLSLELNFYAGGNFLNLAKASVYGSVFYSSEGEFELEVFAGVQLGPNGFNISGSAHLFISYLDENGKASGGIDDKVLDIRGSLSVSAEVFWINVGSINLSVGYNSNSGDITVGVTVSVPYIAKKCWRTFLGRICIYYPSFRNRTYTFTVGNLKLDPPDDPPPPPVVLGEVNGEGILILNVGPDADARNLLNDEMNEGVLIERSGPGSDQGEKITITMFGVSQTFDNVLGVLLPDMGAGEDSVEIYAGVTIPVTVHFGSGNDSLTADGSGMVIAYGDEGDDNLEGGSGNDRLFGGVGNDVIDGKAGQDWIEGYGEDGPLGEDEDDADVLIGGEDNDTIKGGPGFDRIAGDLAEITGDENTSVLETIASTLGGSDIIEGGEDGDVIFGGSGNDLIHGDQGNDILIGDDGTVSVSQEEGQENGISLSYTLVKFNFAGNDIIIGGADNDTLYGQEGNDILIGDDGSVNDTSAVAYVNGSDGSDSIYGQEGEDKVFGGGSDDNLYGDKEGDSNGSLQRDILIGDSGTIGYTGDMFAFNDVTIITNSGESAGGADTIEGNVGNDIILGGTAGDWIYGQGGNDVLLGDTGTIELTNGTLSGLSTANESQGGADTVEGNAGSDLIIGGSNDGGTDNLYGDGANPGNDDDADIIIGDNGEILLIGNSIAQARTTDTEALSGGIDVIYGNDGDDLILGGVMGDIIFGNDGNDILLGDNALFGMVIPVQSQTLVSRIDMDNNERISRFTIFDADQNTDPDPVDVDTMTWTVGGILEITFTDNALGGDDTINGGSGNDVIYGQLGADKLYGDTGNDVLFGDLGRITHLTRESRDPLLRLNGNQLEYLLVSPETGGHDTIYGGPGEDVMFGGAGDDIMYGDEGDDYMEGNMGSDTMFGGLGEDDMIGGSSDLVVPDQNDRTDESDVMDGGDGHDVVVGDNGRITRQIIPETDQYIRYTPGTNGLGTGHGLENNAVVRDVVLLEQDEIGGGDHMHGGDGDDIMYGGFGDDHLYGDAGNDAMYGGLGNDMMDGGVGNDGMIGDKGTLVADILDGSEQTTLYTPADLLIANINVAGTLKWYVTLEDVGLGGNDTMWGQAGNDAMHGGFGDDIMYGDAGNDALFGNLGNDMINGGSDSDHLYGGAGNDNLDGGIGSDIVCGGEGSDYLVADSLGDRLIDWMKPYNTFVKPIKSNGFPIVINSRIPWVQQFLLDLAAADGAVNPSEAILIP